MSDREARVWTLRDALVPREEAEAASPVLRRRLYIERLRIFAEASQQAGLLSAAACLLVALALYDRISLLALIQWCAVCLSCSLAVSFNAWRFGQRRAATRSTTYWTFAATVFAAALGLSWAMLLYASMQGGDEAVRLVVMFVLGAVSFGALSMTGFYLPAYLAFFIPIVLGVMAWSMQQAPGWLAQALVLLVFAVFVMMRAGAQIVRGLQRTLLLSVERDSWARRVNEERQRLQVLLKAIGDGVIATDTEGRVQYLNATAERLTGWRSEAARGWPLQKVLGCAGAADLVAECVRAKRSWRLPGEVQLLSRDGADSWSVQLKASPMLEEEGDLEGVVVVIRDVTALSGLEAAISYHAEHDSLTGLPNRKAFESYLTEALATVDRSGPGHVICYLDLDQFKVINDTCGHNAGDEVLKQLSAQFAERIRDTDVLARLGGDEFGILLYRCTPDKARRIAESLCALMREYRFHWDGQVYQVGVSIGVVPLDPSSTAAKHMAAADAACYVAKDQGRNRVHTAHAEDAEVAHRHDEMRLTSRIQQALDEGLFRLRYQKIVPLSPSGAVEVEFLLSMRSVDGHLMAPGVFLPAAERFNMMGKIDRHVLRLALEAIAGNRPQLRDVASFAINLSGQSLADEEFLDYVLELLDETRVDPRRLCFEITETAVIANLERALRFIEGLRALGCRFALDDFGSGLSSFGYLKNLPVDCLKIDGQFVKNMCSDPIDQSMVEAIHRVGHVMGLKTIAEFVEDEETLVLLRKMGVDYAQGWSLHRPELLIGTELPPQPTRQAV